MTGCKNRASESFICSKYNFKLFKCQIFSAPSNNIQVELSVNDVPLVKLLEFMQAFPNQIIEVNLESNGIGDTEAEALATALPNSQVTKLSLVGCLFEDETKIGDAGAQALAAALPNSQVTQLNLWGNKSERPEPKP